MCSGRHLASREHVLREITPYDLISSTSAVAWQRKAVIKFILLKQLEQMHVADESILYSLYAAMINQSSRASYVSAKVRCFFHTKNVCAVSFLPSNTNRLDVRQTAATITRSYGPIYSNTSPLKVIQLNSRIADPTWRRMKIARVAACGTFSVLTLDWRIEQC